MNKVTGATKYDWTNGVGSGLVHWVQWPVAGSSSGFVVLGLSYNKETIKNCQRSVPQCRFSINDDEFLCISLLGKGAGCRSLYEKIIMAETQSPKPLALIYFGQATMTKSSPCWPFFPFYNTFIKKHNKQEMVQFGYFWCKTPGDSPFTAHLL